MKIYLSYRREDSADVAGRLSDRLAAHFGPQSVFMDVDAIPVGDDFRTTLRTEIEQCDVVIVLIGDRWLQTIDAEGRRRLDNRSDFVRFEIKTALEREIPVVPVLVKDAQMPPINSLPAPLRGLALRQAAILRSGASFRLDSDRLVRGIEGLLEASRKARREQTPEVPEIDLGTPGSITVFVSHSTRDRTWVEQEIVGPLERHSIHAWYAKSSIKTASQWEREILHGLEGCDWFLLVVSPSAAQSEWIKDELNWAIFNRPTRIVPVIMEHCNLWDFHIYPRPRPGAYFHEDPIEDPRRRLD